MKELAFIAFFASSAASAGGFGITLGMHDRPGGLDAAVEYTGEIAKNLYAGAEVGFVDFGEQPHTTTRNRALNLDGMLRYKMGDWAVVAKAGLTSTALSEPYRKWDWDKGLAGSNAGLALEYYINNHIALRAQVQNLRYVQCSQDGMNDYLYYSIGIALK